ncbi:hypothetical protein G2W53_027091 [Senna tora]|uniref:Uncharacterized protein n=1 Tax=Senna tora TaxID=362788 RepID=A0A834TIP0_9FABA|nr:hypothetical protein G2W53_027091 [Senna tora]
MSKLCKNLLNHIASITATEQATNSDSIMDKDFLLSYYTTPLLFATFKLRKESQDCIVSRDSFVKPVLAYASSFFLRSDSTAVDSVHPQKGGESFTLGESPSSCESLGPANAASQALSDSDLELPMIQILQMDEIACLRYRAKAELVSADESVDVEEKAESAKSTLAAEAESDSEVGDGLEVRLKIRYLVLSGLGKDLTALVLVSCATAKASHSSSSSADSDYSDANSRIAPLEDK